jgi:hypothetical protein
MSGRLRVMSIAVALWAVIGIGSMAGRGVFAQDATPTPSTSSGSSGTTDTTKTDSWDTFLNDFASALGVTDQATIDSALNSTINTTLAAKVTAGELTQEQADIIKAQVANGDYSGFKRVIGSGGHMGGPSGDGNNHGHGGPMGPGHDGKGGMSGGSDKSTTPATDATPAAASSAPLA